LPLASTAAVHTVLPPSLTVTVAPGSAVPAITGDAATVEPADGAANTGTATTVSLLVDRLVDPVPTVLVCTALTVIVPSGRALTLIVPLNVPVAEQDMTTLTVPDDTVTMPWPMLQVPLTGSADVFAAFTATKLDMVTTGTASTVNVSLAVLLVGPDVWVATTV
jgi:hypothetical protein